MRSSLVATAFVLAASTSLAHADDAVDFIADAKLYYRVVACGNADPLPEGIDAAIVDKHCGEPPSSRTRARCSCSCGP